MNQIFFSFLKLVPSSIFWSSILPFIPHLGITKEVLYHQRCVLSCLRILRSSIFGLQRHQKDSLRHQLYDRRHYMREEDGTLAFVYEDDEVYLSLYPLSQNHHDPDYLLIWK